MSDQTDVVFDKPVEPGHGLSINERQAARADENARARLEPQAPAPQEDPSATLAVRALELANEQGEAPEETVRRADAYFEFLKGKSNG